MTTKTKMLSTSAIVAIAAIVASVSIVSALSICEPPNCLEMTREDGTYKLRGDALAQYHDINGRQIDFVALKGQLDYLPANAQPIYIVVEGSTDSVSKFVSEYSLVVELGKSTDTYTSQAGTISKASLQKYFDTVSFNEFLTSDIHIAHVGGYKTNAGEIGIGALPLTTEQKESIGTLTDTFADNKITDLIRTSSDVEKVQ